MNKIKTSVLIAALFTFTLGLDSRAANIPASALSMIVSSPIGAAIGLVRGSGYKSVQYSETLSEQFDVGSPANMVAKPIGMGIGLVAGSAYGAIRGLGDGVGYSMEEPFSAKSFSVAGDFWDYDPYDVANF